MARISVGMASAATILYAATALAATSAQESCNFARISAWRRYVSCVELLLAKEAKGQAFDEYKSAKCRHSYFETWTKFQTSGSVAGSTCVGPRFQDNGDGSVTDHLTTLSWEKKTNGGTHDAAALYTWSTGPPYKENGTAFGVFLPTLNNGAGFAGANGWRLPTLAELETIVLNFPCTGGFASPGCACQDPCIDPIFGPTQPNSNFTYSTVTPYLPNAVGTRGVNFRYHGFATHPQKTDSEYVRAVRGGL